MRNCKWCNRGYDTDRLGNHLIETSFNPPTLKYASCPNWQPLDKPEDFSMTYEKLGRRYEEL